MRESNCQQIYKLRQSSSSFNISDIVSFTYGPFLSRFWLMRKETNLTNKQKLLNDAPFYAWDCISLSIRGKWDIYLIIKNELVMSDFLKLLIYRMETLDGYLGTAIPLK